MTTQTDIKKLPNDWTVFEEASMVAEQAVVIIKAAANKAIEERGVFRIVLAGGTTPEYIYQLLAKENLNWSHWECYLGDERCLPVDDADRNSQMVQRTLLAYVPIPKENIYFMAAEQGAETASLEYASILKNKLPFDMVLLGMGEDGHTASLFPGHVHHKENLTHAVYESPKPPSDRVSISAKALSENRELLIFVTGSSKQTAVAQWLDGKEGLPVTTISSLNTRRVFLDQAALNNA